MDVTVVKDDRSFAALEKEWDDLYANSPQATPFQSWAWLYSWWESYGEDYELRLIAVRNEGLLVGLVPLMLERRWGFTRLLFIGTGRTAYLDMLIRQGWGTQVLAVGVQTLRQLDDWQVADLQELRPTAAAWGLFQNWDGLRTCIAQSSCPVIDVKPWQELLMSTTRNNRSTTRRTLRKIEKDGVYCKAAGPSDAKQAVHRWIALHRESWQGRGIDPEHLTQRFESHMEAAVCRMVVRGLGTLSMFWRGEEVIAAHFFVLGKDFVGLYLDGATQEARQRYQLSSLIVWNGINIAHSRNIAYLDLLMGETPYKLRWSPKITRNHRVILGRNATAWTLYARYYVPGYRILRRKGSRYVRSRSTPQWVKNIVYRLYGWLYG